MRQFIFIKTHEKLARTLYLILNVLISLVFMISLAVSAESIEKISVDKKDTTVTVEISLSKAISFVAETLQAPYRIEIEMSAILRNLPEQIRGQHKFKSVKLENRAKAKSILVLETNEPMLIRSASFAQNEPKIILTLVATDTETFATFLSLKAEQKAKVAEIPTEKIEPRNPKLNAGKITYDTKKIIVIDAGHGGIDPGAIGKNGTKEKDVVLAFSKVLRDKLRNYPNLDVRLSRDVDKYLTLIERVKFSRDAHADLLISVHADTLRGKTARGATFYTLSDKASDEEAEALARKENKVDEIAGFKLPAESPEIAGILVDLVRRESKNHANYFAIKAAGELEKVTRMSGKPVRSAGFAVLTAPEIPSVLIELGFLSSTEDEKLLTDPKWRATAATSIAASVADYLSEEIAVNSNSRAASPYPK